MACEMCKKPYVAPADDNVFDSDGKPHVCNTCGKSFSLKIQLKRHMQTHESGLPYVCNSCEKKDKQAYNLRLSKKDSILCETCNRTFTSKRLLHKHSCQVSSKEVDDESEDNFEETTPKKKKLKEYLQPKSKKNTSKSKAHKDIPQAQYQCEECAKSFTQFQAYEKHRQIHKIFKCDSCNAGFISKEGLQNHRNSENCAFKGEKNGGVDNDDKKHACEICSKSFTRKSALEGHMASHLIEKNYSEVEDDSDYDADYSSDYKGKKSNEQPKEVCLPILKMRRTFSCKICQKVCYSKNGLAKHMSYHQNLPSDSTEKKRFKHNKIVSEKKYICRICSDVFYIKEEYKKHKLTHSPKSIDASKLEEKEKRTYTCKICSKVFQKKKHLKKHLKLHLLNADSNSLNANSHLSNVKSGLSNADSQPSYANSHPSNAESNSLDSNENPRKKQNKRTKKFACGICGKLFAGERCMIKHEAKHTENNTKGIFSPYKKGKQVKSFVCEFCVEDFTGRKHAYAKHKLSHTPEVCGICDARFVDRAGLREHLKTHIGTEEARRFLECSQKAVHAKSSLQNPEAKVEYIYLVLR